MLYRKFSIVAGYWETNEVVAITVSITFLQFGQIMLFAVDRLRAKIASYFGTFLLAREFVRSLMTSLFNPTNALRRSKIS